MTGTAEAAETVNATRCECDLRDHPHSADGRCQNNGDGAELMTGGKVHASPALCMPCLFGCAE